MQLEKKVFAQAWILPSDICRKRCMVDNSSLLIAVEGKSNGGTARTIAYARKLNREIVLLHVHE